MKENVKIAYVKKCVTTMKLCVEIYGLEHIKEKLHITKIF